MSCSTTRARRRHALAQTFALVGCAGSFAALAGGASPEGAAAAPRKVVLTIAVNGSGAVTSTAGACRAKRCALRVVVGKKVTLVAKAGGQFRFKSWGGACRGTSSKCRITLRSNKKVTASFQRIVPPQAPTPPDTTPPTVPAGVVATPVAYSVGLAWNASTDNAGVTGYVVVRDGLELGTTATATYEDATVAPGTTYSYDVRAYDAAGNRSADSTPVSVTTPSVTIALTAAAHDDLGNGRHMTTDVRLSGDTGRIDGFTQSSNNNWLVGFHGGVVIRFIDAGGNIVGITTGEHVYGVSAKFEFWVPAERRDPWTETVSPLIVRRTASLEILHFTTTRDAYRSYLVSQRDVICSDVWVEDLPGPCPIDLIGW